jgi:hypothetical protein
MNVKRYIFYLLQTPIGTISLDDELFLREILRGTTSAYKMHRTMKRSYELKKLSVNDFSNPLESYLIKPPAYININKRFRKLNKLGFLEEINNPGGYLHSARNYKISEKGFVFLLGHKVHFDFYKYFKELSKTKLFQIFIVPYFDNKTVQECTLTLFRFIVFYLEDICIKISNTLNPDILERYHFDRTIPLAEQYGKIDNPEDNLVYANPYLYELFITLKNSYKSLILDIISMDQEILKTRRQPDKEDKRQTLILLSNDKKFMNTLKKIKEEINHQTDKLLNV